MFKKATRVVTCPICGKEFVTTHWNKKYCSPDCMWKAIYERQKSHSYRHKCKNCGTAFYGNAQAHFCCDRCKDEYNQIMKQKEMCQKCVYSILLQHEPVCNYHAVEDITRTSLGKTGYPCELYRTEAIK